VLLGAGAKVLGDITIYDYAKVGAGSVVLQAVPKGGTAVGNPARIVHTWNDASLLYTVDEKYLKRQQVQ
jgi:serine O-acetyltransferase